MVVSKMIELEDALKDGQYDPHTVRTLIWSMQWRAAKLRPRVYGDNKRIVMLDALIVAVYPRA